MIEKTYNVGIYCRLSNDDERDGESVSIENQKLLLQNYVRQRGWNEIDTYIDDGYSGTNFDRPGVKRLIEDAKAALRNPVPVNIVTGPEFDPMGRYIAPDITAEKTANGVSLHNWKDGLDSRMVFHRDGERHVSL